MGESGQAATMNFGQRPFAYTPPTGFKALNTQNLPESTVVDGGEYFNAVLYTGNGSTQSITGVGFQPDLVWLKVRSTADNHKLTDAVRGATKTLFSNTTDNEFTEANAVTSFDSDGFSLGSDSGNNGSGRTFVAWNWKANGAGVSNTDGSITSTVSANPTAGFSVVTYTGTGVNNATVGHGLGVAPAMIIVKDRTNTYNWDIYHQSLGLSATLTFTTSATRNVSAFGTNAPTSTVFSVQNSYTNTSSANLVAYCFSEVAGYSRFGSYTGNGSADGPFVFCGFRPAFVLVKRTDSGNNWFILDTARNTANLTNNQLYPNSSAAEGTNGDCNIDILSNGFKLRTALDASNGSGGTYIFMAFAEHPFSVALAR
jgi:hypothetical protein